MPQLPGDGLVADVLEIRADLPIILCTGDSERIDAGKASRLGVDYLIFKPVTMNEMAHTIRKALDRNKVKKIRSNARAGGIMECCKIEFG